MKQQETDQSHEPWLFEAGDEVDHFRVVRPLGRGGMAQVFLARDTKLGRKVALKVVQSEALGSKQAIERFTFEARTTARFSHPNIVTIHAVGEHEGKPYVALEYLEGQTLRARLEQERPGEQEILRMAAAICGALAEAHSGNVVHRDLKPENVMLGRDGRLRVLDFGLASRVVDHEAPPAAEEMDAPSQEQASTMVEAFKSRGGGIRGTPAYMAPEQWQERELTGKTDIWALGVTLYEMVSGRRPYDEPKTFKQAMLVCGAEPAPRVVGVSSELTKIVADCLEKDPARRPDAAELTRRLEELLHRDPRLGAEESPFRGLFPFDERHSAFFFGRDTETATFVERLRATPVLAVVGPSGAGKSSFVAAGVIPRLRERGPLEVLQLRPGSRPFWTLCNRLATAESTSGSGVQSPFGALPTPRGGAVAEETGRAGELADRLRAAPHMLNLWLHRLAERRSASVLLFVDQLEELYTQVEDEEARRAFMQAICLAADDPQAPVRVVFTLRDDFLVQLAETPAAQSALSHITVLRSPDPEALREIVTRPLELVGYRCDDPALVDEMVAEVQGEASCLPLLQFAGQVLWDHRDPERHLLRRATHEAMGGVAGALVRHAEGVIGGLSADEVRLVRALFLRLVTAERTRRLVSRGQLLEGLDRGAQEVLQRLVTARLVTVKLSESDEEGELELAHESLITAWSRLRRWIDESREDLAFLAEAEQAAALWERRSRRVEEVWRGDALQEAVQRIEHLTTEVPPRVREFLRAGKALEARRIRRRRLAVAGTIAVLVVIAVVLALMNREARQQRNQAEEQRAEAEEKRAVALREGARAALLRDDINEARAKLRMALEIQHADSLLGRALLRQIRGRPLQRTVTLPTLQVNEAAFSPDGQQLAVGIIEGKVFLLEPRTGRVLHVHRALGEITMSGLAFSPDGQRLAIGTYAGAEIWHPSSGKVLRLKGYGVAFHPDGRLLASVEHDRVTLWNATSGERVRTQSFAGKSGFLRFSPDGSHLAVCPANGDTVHLWDLRTWKRTALTTADSARLRGLSFSPDGKLLVAGDHNGYVRLWEVATGVEKARIGSHDSWIWELQFSPDGKLVATGSADHTARLWDVTSGKQRAVLTGPFKDVLAIAFSPDSRTVALSGVSSQVSFWDTAATINTAARRTRPSAAATGVDFHPDGRTLVSVADTRLVFWDAASGRVQATAKAPSGAASVRFSPDGRLLAMGNEDGTLRVWDTITRKVVKVLGGQGARIPSLDFHPAGKLVATASLDGSIWLWDIALGRLVHQLRGHTNRANQVSFSPDGRQLLSASNDRTVMLWDTATGAARELSRLPRRRFAAGWSPDGHLVAYSDDRGIRLRDMRSGAERKVGECPKGAWTLSFAPSGGGLAVGCSTEGTLLLLDLAGPPRKVLGHSEWVIDLRYDREGRRFASASHDRTVRLWDAAGRPIWRGPLLHTEGPQLLTHNGWIGLGRSKAAPASTAWGRAVAEHARFACESPGGDLLCVQTYDDRLQLWQLARDRLLLERTVPGLDRVLALPTGCVTRTNDGEAVLHGIKQQRTLHRKASAVGWGEGQLLLGVPEGVVALDASGARIARTSADPEATAVGKGEGWLALGYRDGTVHFLVGGRRKKAEPVETASPSRVVRILEGPRGTAIVGFANGVLGIWDARNGTALHKTQLHGAVVHLLIEDRTLFAATDLGDHETLDLGVFYRDRCDLLREVWQDVPVVWEGGVVVLREPPPHHGCRSR